MFLPAEIEQIHRDLTRDLPSGLVIFGGSYLYGEIDERSDLDFYYVGSIRDCWRARRHRLVIQRHKTGRAISVMFVPRLAARQGWIYVWGRDLDGNMFRSGVHRRLVGANCLKFAAFNYLRSILYPEDAPRHFRKAQIQLSVAYLMAGRDHIDCSEPIFSEKYLRSRGFWRPITGVNDILTAYRELSQFWRFNIINYLIYNARFLARGEWRYVFVNPDRRVGGELITALKNIELSGTMMEKIKQEIFPVIII